jgi:hypothetical protein
MFISIRCCYTCGLFEWRRFCSFCIICFDIVIEDPICNRDELIGLAHSGACLNSTTDRNDITEMLLKVALSTINQTKSNHKYYHNELLNLLLLWKRFNSDSINIKKRRNIYTDIYWPWYCTSHVYIYSLLLYMRSFWVEAIL